MIVCKSTPHIWSVNISAKWDATLWDKSRIHFVFHKNSLHLLYLNPLASAPYQDPHVVRTVRKKHFPTHQAMNWLPIVRQRVHVWYLPSEFIYSGRLIWEEPWLQETCIGSAYGAALATWTLALCNRIKPPILGPIPCYPHIIWEV